MSRGVTWDAKEVKALVECWADQKMQNMINNGKSNEDIFAVIANEVGRDPDCCMRKMFCLKRIYRKYKGDQAKTGGGEILPPSAISGVYDVLDEVLHEQPCSAPVLYSSLDGRPTAYSGYFSSIIAVLLRYIAIFFQIYSFHFASTVFSRYFDFHTYLRVVSRVALIKLQTVVHCSACIMSSNRAN